MPQMKRCGTYLGPNLAVLLFLLDPERGGGGGEGRRLRPSLDPPLNTRRSPNMLGERPVFSG